MGISPWYVGQTRPIWSFTWKDDSDNPIDLTGATVTLRFREDVIPKVGYPMKGDVDVTAPLLGQFTYAPDPDDFASDGSYVVQARATYDDDTVIEADLLPLTVKDQL